MRARKKAKKYRRRVWGGFTDGRLNYRMIDTGWGGFGPGGDGVVRTLLVFTSYKDARKQFEDVRPIQISEI